MNNIDIHYLLQLRTGSSRLPGKMLMPFYNGKTIPEIIIERLIQTGIPANKIIAATTTNPKDDQLIENLQKAGCLIFRGSENNVLQRFIDAADEQNAKQIIRICADNPFLNVGFLKKIIDIDDIQTFDYISYYQDETTPAIKTHYGLFCEYTTISVLKTVAQNTNNSTDLEHVTPYIYNNPEKFKIKKIGMPGDLIKNPWLRLTIDTKEDFDVAQILYNKAQNVNDYNELINLAIEEKVKSQMESSILRNSK